MTRHPARAALYLISLVALAPASAQVQTDEIVAVLQKSVEDWNRGDIGAFMRSYEQSADTTFVGSEVLRGTDAVLQLTCPN